MSVSKLYSIFLVFGLIASLHPVMAQGCSDAGFCTIGDLKSTSVDSSEQKNKFTYLLPIGLGDQQVLVITPGLQYERYWASQGSFQLKLTGNYAQGNLGTALGAGDVALSFTQRWALKKNWKLALSLGSKIPLNTSNLNVHGLDLPLAYQSSLGTFDLIAGVTIKNKRWQFSAGWQQPIYNVNTNTFLPTLWTDTLAAAYTPTNDFKRRGDVLLRTAYSFQKGDHFSANAGLLAIYHLGEDQYKIPSSSEFVSIPGSDGLTLNLTFAAWYRFSAKTSIGLIFGTPIIVRDVRPDGLTRSIVLAPEISWRF